MSRTSARGSWLRSTFLLFPCLLLVVAATPSRADDPPVESKRTSSCYPCQDYVKGLRGKGNFGVLVDQRAGPPFGGTHHLAEDVWLPAGTEVRSIADGRVRYSAFSPTWTDAKGVVHWNLGNVIVIEHELSPAEGDLTHVCSFYVHLGDDRAVKVGDEVKRGQRIGSIGKDRSEENGRYPVHLHFGIHKGPYFQVTETLKRELEREATTTGLPVGIRQDGTPRFVVGKIERFEHQKDDTLVIHLEGGEKSVYSLEIASNAPPDSKRPPPPDIAHWCVGYGEKLTVAEWLRPSEWIGRHAH